MISNVHAPMDVNNSHMYDTVGNQHIFQNPNEHEYDECSIGTCHL